MKVTPEMIKDLRKRHKITQQKLADSLFHIKKDTLAEWECGRRNCQPIIWWAMKLTWDSVDIWVEEKGG